MQNANCFSEKSKISKALTIRIPVISGLNDDETEQRKIGMFLKTLLESGGHFRIQLLRQHHIAEPKYTALNREYLCRNVSVPDDRIMKRFSDILNEYGSQRGGSNENIGN